MTGSTTAHGSTDRPRHCPEPGVAANADDAVLDGLACLRCGRADRPMVPAGVGPRGQVFACADDGGPIDGAGEALDATGEALDATGEL